jgi:hypothetical protein
MWFSIEVFDGASSASLWSDAYGDTLIEAAFSNGADDWNWHRHTWGVVLELSFEDEAQFDRFRNALPVQTALEAVPDPVSGIIVSKGRGGSAGRVEPRRPRPLAGGGAAALPLPQELFFDEDDLFDQYRSAHVLTPALAG